MSRSSRKRRKEGGKFPQAVWIQAVLLGLCAIVPFVPALWAGFLWDDFPALHDNVFLRSWGGLWKTWSTVGRIPNESHYWPVLYTTFWAEFQIFGLNALGYHTTNILLHVANTLLVWRILKRLGIGGAAWAAALFAVHPVRVESVVWIIERKDVLSGLFYLLSALCFLRFEDGEKRRDYVFSLIFFTMGLLSKTMVVTLPAGLLVAHWWRTGRLDRTVWLRVLPFFAVGLLYALFDVTSAVRIEEAAVGLTPLGKLIVAGRAFWFYVVKLAVPYPLVHIYERWDVESLRPWMLVYPLTAAGLAAGAFALRERIGRGVCAAVLYFGMTLSPVLGFVEFTYLNISFVADRFLYLAAIGPFALAAAGAWRLAGRHQGGRRWLLGIGTTVVIVLGTLSWTHAQNFRDMETLFTHVIRHNDRSDRAWSNLGVAYMRQGRIDEAAECFERALALRPGSLQALNNMGIVLLQRGDVRRAANHYRRAIDGGAPWSTTRSDLAWILAATPDEDLRDPGEAVRLAEEALEMLEELDPEREFPVQNVLDTLAVSYAAAGEFDKAVETAERAMELATRDGDMDLARQIGERLALFLRGETYVDPSLAPAIRSTLSE